MKTAIAAAKMLPRTPQTRRLPEPVQDLPPKYIHRINNKLGHRYRAIIRWQRKDYRLGMFESIPEALKAQEAKCIELGITYDDAMNQPNGNIGKKYKK